MALINPINDFELPSEFEKILKQEETVITSPAKQDLDATRRIFSDSGASVKNVAAAVSNILDNSSQDGVKLRAAELVLKVHGILNEMDAPKIPNVVINITGSDNKTLINLVVPS